MSGVLIHGLSQLAQSCPLKSLSAFSPLYWHRKKFSEDVGLNLSKTILQGKLYAERVDKEYTDTFYY